MEDSAEQISDMDELFNQTLREMDDWDRVLRWGRSPIPDDFDEEIAHLLQVILALPPDQRQHITASLT